MTSIKSCTGATPLKTKQRILVVSLALFNELGEPNVTTVDISNEMDISPGNLYYHYRNKDEIVDHIFQTFDAELLAILNTQNELTDLVEYWLFLRLIIEKNWHNRFIFRDMNNILGKYKPLHRKVIRITNHLEKTLVQLIHHLVHTSQALAVSELISGNMVQSLINWPYFQYLREHQNRERPLAQFSSFSLGNAEPDTLDDNTKGMADLISQSCYQVFVHLMPYLNDEQKTIIEELALGY